MTCETDSPYLNLLRNRIDLQLIPFTERGSRLMLLRHDSRLYVRLAERWTKWEHEVGHYRRRPPIVDDLVLSDADGHALDLNLTSAPHALHLDTRIGPFAVAFADAETLYFCLPAGRCDIQFHVYAPGGQTDRRGGEFKGDAEHRQIHRNVAYTTNAHILENTITPTDNNGFSCVALKLEANDTSALTLNITPRLGFNRSLPLPGQVFAAAAKSWHDWFAAAPPVEERYAAQYYYAWWVMRAGLISPRFFLTRESMVPCKTWYVGVWQWDAFFHALAYRYVDIHLAEDQLRIVLDHQRADGMIPDAIHDEGLVERWPLPNSQDEAQVTKPPLIAWTALKLYESSGNLDFLQEVYEPLQRWNTWWFERNDDDGDGIAQYNHPYSSGLDDSPLWDQGMPVESPELNTYLVMQMDALARIAGLIGEEDEAEMWRRRAEELTQKMIAHFWDEEAGLFWATKDHQAIRVRTLFNLYPLLTGRLPRAMTDRIVAHLSSPNEFWTPYPLATVACTEAKYDPDQMWRGPTWVNINYLFIEGLVRCGYLDLARQLRDRTLDLIMRHGDIYEYYNPATGDPPPKAAPIFGWSSAVFIDLAIKAAQSGGQTNRHGGYPEHGLENEGRNAVDRVTRSLQATYAGGIALVRYTFGA